MASLPRLNKDLILDPQSEIGEDLSIPPPDAFYLPEKILQFGSGRFLRGFVDFFVDRAIRAGTYDGRIVVVQTTGSGRSNLLGDQDGIFTLWEKGLVDGEPLEKYTLVASISRALSATDEWDEVLAVARSPELECIISNTTEVGITLDPEDSRAVAPPRSFPGKLTALLYERGRTLGWAENRGVVVLPCELLDQNGDTLRDIVMELGRRWELGDDFERWVSHHNVFCNTLVDRIVTGLDRQETLDAISEQLGYEDHLLTIAETYRLWAIQGGGSLRSRLPFLGGDPGIVIASDISPFRERKVRILNGTHTTFVALAFLYGCKTVLDAMQDELVGDYVRQLMLEEIVPTVSAGGASEFAHEVLDRFSNPFLEHLLINVTLQGTSKWRVRVVPTIRRYRELNASVPKRILLGLAAHILFVRGMPSAGHYEVVDQHAERIAEYWTRIDDSEDADVRTMVRAMAADATLWGEDLTQIDGVTEQTGEFLIELLRRGPRSAIQNVLVVEHGD